MKAVPLEGVLTSLESGARPAGGASVDSGEIPSLGGEHLSADGGFNFASLKRIPRSFFENMRGGRVAARDILVVKDGATTGKTSFVGPSFPFAEAAVNEHVFCVRVDRAKACPEYVFHFLRSPQGQRAIALDFRGATVGEISRDFAKKTRLPLPPLREQRRIAEILDKADALRAKRRAALAKLDTLAQSIFLDMFGDPATNPKSLSICELGKISAVTTGSTPSREVSEHFGGRVPWVKTTEVTGESIRDTEEKLTDSGLKAIRGKLNPVGSVVIAMYGQGKTRGRCALLEIEAAVNQACAVVRPTADFEPVFMWSQLRLGYDRLRSLGRGGNQENLNLELVKAFRVLLPPKSQQGVFVSRVETLRAIKKLAVQGLSGLEQLFASLQHRAFRGEL